MQQLNSLYRGDQSDSLSNIMGMQYAPHAQLSKFSGDMMSTGMQLSNATNRTIMSLSSQEAIERNRLKEQARATNLNYLLNDRAANLADQRFGFDVDKDIFGRQKDVATFNQTNANNKANQDVLAKNAETQRILALQPNKNRVRTEQEEDADALAEWDIYTTQLQRMMDRIPENEQDPQKAADRKAMGDWIKVIGGWRGKADHRRYLKAFKNSPMFNPLFGIIGAKPGESTVTVP
jgi:hypothetical protein